METQSGAEHFETIRAGDIHPSFAATPIPMSAGKAGIPNDGQAVDPLAKLFADKMGNSSALHLWSWSHLLFGILLLDIGLYFWLRGLLVLSTAVILTLSFCFFATVLFRLVVVLLAVFGSPEIKVSQAEIEATSESDLPVYTILVPLYKEANVADSAIRSLSRLRYPRNRLDIKLLLEEDDALTVNAVNAIKLGPEFDVILIPPSQPRTKPKACNYGLARARGEFAVIFDAEDRPESDQLLKVVHTFRRFKSSADCIQAKLNYFNARENMLTRWFAIEYTSWFEMVLPGLQKLSAPIPLGGTSNHFRTQQLIDIGGWDPFNVTEDCDLGIRLAIQNRKTVLIDSTTWEEANVEIGNWIRQRSRWVKGYFQTHLVHTKRPLELIGSLGAVRTVYFLLTVGGVAFMQFLNIVLWAITAIYLGFLSIDLFQGRNAWTVIAGSRDEYRVAWKMIYLGAGEDPVWGQISLIAFIASMTMLFANGLFIAIGLLACRRHGYKDLWIAALTSPVYWLLTSIAAWKGVIQLIYRPHFWEKTRHGLSNVSDEPQSLEHAS